VLEFIKKNKISVSIISLGLLIFVVGLVLTITDKNESYAASIEDYMCADEGYEVVSDKDGGYVCCPKGYEFWLLGGTGDNVSGVCRVNVASEEDAQSKCPNNIYILNQSYYCEADFKKTILAKTCAPGTYYNGEGGCSTCPAGSYCVGTKYIGTETEKIGIKSCPFNSTSVVGSISDKDCKITCAPGTYYNSGGLCNECTPGSYCPGGTFSVYELDNVGIYKCDDGKGSGYGATSCASYGDDGATGEIVPNDSTAACYKCLNDDSFNWAMPQNDMYNCGQDEYGENVYGEKVENIKNVKDCNALNLQTYTITFDVNGGTPEITSAIKKHNVDFEISVDNPSKKDQKFLGWRYDSPNGYKILSKGDKISFNANTTLIAQWGNLCDIYGYYIFFDGNGGLTADGKTTYYSGNEITGPNLSSFGSKNIIPKSMFFKDNDTFKEWNTKSDGTGVSYAEGSEFIYDGCDEKFILYAIWDKESSGETTTPEVKKYTLIYNGNVSDDSVKGLPEKGEYPSGTNTTISSNDPTRSGYVFRGWNTKADGTGTSYKAGDLIKIDANVTLYAQWKKTYLVSYNLNGGTGLFNGQFKLDGINLKITSEIPTKEGYTFKEWNTEKDGSGDSFQPNGEYTKNEKLMLYAIWEKNADNNTSNDGNTGSSTPDTEENNKPNTGGDNESGNNSNTENDSSNKDEEDNKPSDGENNESNNDSNTDNTKPDDEDDKDKPADDKETGISLPYIAFGILLIGSLITYLVIRNKSKVFKI